MRLQKEYFEKIALGEKTVEARINDEKRQKLSVGDHIEFSLMTDETKKIRTIITNLHYFDTFKELASHCGLQALGFTQESVDEYATLMLNVYSKKEQREFGVVGIEITVLDTAQ